MRKNLERLLDAYSRENKEFVLPASRQGANDLLDQLKTIAQKLGDFESFPEGNAGVVLFALLTFLQRECPDPSDLSHVMQGLRQLTEATHEILADEIMAAVP
jgi:hypothetical protein